MSKNKFVSDTILIDEGIDDSNIDVSKVTVGELKAVFLPYYIDPKSLELKVVLKRKIMPGQFLRNGKKMSLTALTVTLPADEPPLSVEQAFDRLNLDTKITNSTPFGSVMPDPESSSLAYELVLVNIEPLNLINEEHGIFYQQIGEYEIGVADFKDLVEGIQKNVIQDLKTRLVLNELYVLALEEAQNPQQQYITGDPNLIGGGANLPPGFGSQTETMPTADIPEEIIKENSQMNYGAMYSQIKKTTTFEEVTKP